LLRSPADTRCPFARVAAWPAPAVSIALLLLTVCLPAAAADDTLWYRSIGVEEGLSQNFVPAMAADRDGFMWIGTANGLNRWNGYEFERYRYDRDRPDSLSSPTVYALHVDRRGNLWVGTPTGLNRFDPGSNGFQRYGAAFLWRNRRPAPAEVITSDLAGRVWFGWYGEPRLRQFDPRTGRGQDYVIPGTEQYLVTALFADEADRLWVAMRPRDDAWSSPAAGYRLFVVERISEIAGPTLPAARTALKLESAGGHVVQILEDRAHRLWLGRESGGLMRHDPQSGATDRIVANPGSREGLAVNDVRSLALGLTGEIWALAFGPTEASGARPRGLHRVDPETLVVRRVELRERGDKPLSDAEPQCLAVDRFGGLWIGTNAGGLRYADASTRGFTLYRKEGVGPQLLASSFVRAVIRDRGGTLWVGTPKGLSRIDAAGAALPPWRPPSAEAARLLDGYIQALHEDRGGNLWIGTTSGLVVKEPSGAARVHRHRPDDARSLSEDFVQVIHESPDGRVWIGTLGRGLNEFEPRTRSFRRYPVGAANPLGLPGGDVNALYSDARSRLWIGTGMGLVRLDTSPGSAGQFERIAAGDGAIGEVSVLSIGESPASPGVLWVGTEEHGLCRLEVESQATRCYTSRNSVLDGDTVYGILTDGRGRLWLSTNRGIVCFDFVAGEFHSRSADPGLQSTEFNSRAYFKAPDGEMAFGGVGGLNTFYPDQVTDNPYAPKVLVTGVHTSDRDARRPPVGGVEIYRHGMPVRAVEIAYGQRDVTFDYVALHFSNAVRNEYFYRLDSYDAGWQGPVTARSARYTNLAPGAYTFRVKAVSSHGVAGLEEAVFAFVVRPPFYGTWWFRTLAGLGVLLALFAGYRVRIRRLYRQREDLKQEVARRTSELQHAAETLERQAQQLRELDSAKSRFFANISHEFRTPLTLTLGPLRDVRSGLHGQVSRDALDEIELAIRNTERQLELVDQLMELARLDAGQMDFRPERVRLDAWLRLAAAPFESLAKRQRVRLVVETPAEPVYAPVDQEKLDRVLGNLLGNAFKFTPAGGTVSVRLSGPAEGWASIVVEDTGPGIQAEDLTHVFERFYRSRHEGGSVPGTGIGLALVKECVDLHGGAVSAGNRPEGGARFTVRLKAAAAGQDAPVAASALPSSEGREDAAAPSEEGPLVPDEPAADERPAVLIVEDNADMRAYLRKHLAPLYQVLEAERGDEGLARVRSELPDAIVCDVMMPGMDGYEFCRAVRSDPDTDFLPVILLTAMAGPEGRLEGLEGGADDYVTKPFEPAELLARIRNLLHGRERLKARFAGQPSGPIVLARPRQVPSADAVLLDRLRAVLDQSAEDEAFDVTALAAGAGMSRAQLHRRVKEAFGLTPAEMIIQYRLERAAQMLARRAGNVGDIAYAVGFKNVSHFVKRFRERYGETPSSYLLRGQ
jgi:signal transduction histidine kinase/ligand-binding sensor domain-containing protein/DNA-binding response OmpR family regulator